MTLRLNQVAVLSHYRSDYARVWAARFHMIILHDVDSTADNENVIQ